MSSTAMAVDKASQVHTFVVESAYIDGCTGFD
jgi:hypothetical protein